MCENVVEGTVNYILCAAGVDKIVCVECGAVQSGYETLVSKEGLIHSLFMLFKKCCSFRLFSVKKFIQRALLCA